MKIILLSLKVLFLFIITSVLLVGNPDKVNASNDSCIMTCRVIHGDKEKNVKECIEQKCNDGEGSIKKTTNSTVEALLNIQDKDGLSAILAKKNIINDINAQRKAKVALEKIQVAKADKSQTIASNDKKLNIQKSKSSGDQLNIDPPIDRANKVTLSKGKIIKGEIYFTTGVYSTKKIQRGMDWNTGSILLNEWPASLPWAYGSKYKKSFLFLGLFPEKKSRHAWNRDHRRGGALKKLGGLWGGFNHIYFDNATDTSVHIKLGGKQLPVLKPGEHGMVVKSPGEYDLIIRRGDSKETVNSRRIIIDHGGKADKYIYNIDGRNVYKVKEKRYTR